MYIYLNGQIVSDEEAKISVFDHGYMYGLGLFETFRVYQGHPFLLFEHLDRLRKGLKELQINWAMTNEQVYKIVNDLLEKNNLQDAYMRLNISAGDEGLGLTTEPYEQPTMIMYIKSIPPKSVEKKGKILKTIRNTPEGTERLKSHHYLNNILGKRELGQAVDIEGIFLTKEGYIAEGVVSNIFWVKNDIVYTPSTETGILNGITRKFILSLLREKAIPYIEGFYKLEDILAGEEVFITNSIQEIVSLTQVNDTKFPGGNGKFVKLLMTDYNKWKGTLLSLRELRED
ncbi:aminodeoxychorismate lyase [Bacillus suaedaesalsae]|uniref:Aminodeoxychorismate lyase n=1 Tax=Bacillus suaedaesalsae TaxID=2810349 RepID=A0ABS2DDF9_9BACI|nr:aminodeoxychorismate lyase [Bacillus suaedaesalsae]MBM6616080.1 aminodeoxychorismate lyase [Bacillus suaedaesalsae]